MLPTYLLAILVFLIAFALLAVLYGGRRWQAATRELFSRLEDGRRPIAPAVVDESELEGLPEPVQRFFRAVLPEGAPVVAAVDLEHEGTFNMSETGERWVRFTSTQRVLTQRPSFAWNARMAMLPGLSARVHDAYVAGEGLLLARFLGLLPLVEQRGGGEIAAGELMRYFAETAWYPTALLPSQGVRWEAVDDGSARATLTDGDTSVTLLFRFDPAGPIASIRAEARGRVVAGENVPTPWEGRWWSYERRAGMLVPLEGEVSWILPDGPHPYWRGRLTRIEYEVAG